MLQQALAGELNLTVARSENAGVGSLPRIDRSIAVVDAPSWGWLPALTFTGSLGILLLALASSLARLNANNAPVFMWAGLIVLFVPIAGRLLSADPTRRERIGLVIVLGLGLY